MTIRAASTSRNKITRSVKWMLSGLGLLLVGSIMANVIQAVRHTQEVNASDALIAHLVATNLEDADTIVNGTNPNHSTGADADMRIGQVVSLLNASESTPLGAQFTEEDEVTLLNAGYIISHHQNRQNIQYEHAKEFIHLASRDLLAAVNFKTNQQDYEKIQTAMNQIYAETPADVKNEPS